MKIFLVLFLLLVFSITCEKKQNCRSDRVDIVKEKGIDSIHAQTSTFAYGISNVKEYIGKNYSDYQLIDYESYTNRWKNYTDINAPFFCSSDFDGNGKIDYAFLLLAPDGTILLACLLNSVDIAQFVIIDQLVDFNKPLQVVINIKKAGVWGSLEEDYDIPYDGIYVQLIDDSYSLAYYWTNNMFEKFLFD